MVVIPEISGGGHFHDLAAHQFDYLEYLLGPIKQAKGFSLNQTGHYPADDMVTATFLFESGVAGTGSWCFSVPESEKVDTTVILARKENLLSHFLITSIFISIKVTAVSSTSISRIPKIFNNHSYNHC